MTNIRPHSYRAVLREAIAFGLDLRHKKGCDWASPASNFQKNKPCSCGRDALYSKLNDAAFNGVDGPNSEWIACSDRMPGNYITVLITDGDGIRSTAFWSGSHWSVDVVSERDAVVITPEYWMPLPVAPSIPATGSEGSK